MSFFCMGSSLWLEIAILKDFAHIEQNRYKPLSSQQHTDSLKHFRFVADEPTEMLVKGEFGW